MATTVHVKSPAAETQPMLSHTSILIISVFLIGFVSGQTLEPNMRVYGFVAGWAGIAIYFFVDVLEERGRRRAQRMAARNLSNRVDRHVPRRPRANWTTAYQKHVQSQHQYLLVPRSDRRSIR